MAGIYLGVRLVTLRRSGRYQKHVEVTDLIYDLPAADANMRDRREDPDLSASALQKISDIVDRPVSLALNSMNRRAPGSVPVTPTEAAATATATAASANQAQAVSCVCHRLNALL